MFRAVDRRRFLTDTAKYAALLSSTAVLAQAEALEAAEPKKAKSSPSDRLRVAVIGVRSRGNEHISGYLNKANNCEVVAICDCDEGVIGKAMTSVEKAQGKAPTYVKDLRKLLDDPKIDAVSIATPNHWHALAAIWAMQAGKDVYVEKPVSHNVSEGRRIVEAARKYNKICQAGTQIRSQPGIRQAMEFLHAGNLGPIKLARGLCYKSRKSIGQSTAPVDLPKGLDFDLWAGPAPLVVPTRRQLHYDWHWQWPTGNGDFGNQGIHQADVARWGLNKNVHPNSFYSLGGRYGYTDDGETPNTQVCVFDYGDSKLLFEVRGLETEDALADERGKATSDKRMNAKVGNIFYGSKGYLICSNYTDAIALDYDDKVIQVFTGKGDHFGNFANAVRSRKMAEQNGEIIEGHLSSALCHFGNISYKLGQELPFSSSELQSADSAVVATVDRMKKHLTKNGVSLDQAKCKVGAKLTFDNSTEQFPANKAANDQLTREYRKGFEVPAKL